MNPTTYAYDPIAASSTLTRFHGLPASGSSALYGESLAQAQMGALVAAELLAAQAGVVPLLELGDGSRGVVTIGAARDVIDKAPADVRAIYLATHGIVRGLTARVSASESEAPIATIGILPLAVPVVLTVLGVAAIVAGAWYAERRASVQAENTRLVDLAKVDTNARLALASLAATGRIPPELVGNLETSATAEARTAWIPYAVGAASLVATGGALYAAHRRGWV